jgi:hypothetical protein
MSESQRSHASGSGRRFNEDGSAHDGMRDAESTGRHARSEEAGTRNGPRQSRDASADGPDYSAAYGSHDGFFPHFRWPNMHGPGGFATWPPGAAPFGMDEAAPPFGMPPFGMPPFGMPPFGMPPFGIHPFAAPAQSAGPQGWAWPAFRSDGLGTPWGPWSWLTSWWNALTAWWSWLISFGAGPMPTVRNLGPGPGSVLRGNIAMADFWYRWFEAMAQMAYQARQAYQLFLDNGGATHGPYSHAPPPARPTPRTDGSVDIDKLAELLSPLDPMEADQVLHAVQMLQAMDVLQRRRRSRANGRPVGEW